jgi:hypothetical protein
MKKLFAAMILSGALAGTGASAQEHKHAEQKEESKKPVQKETDAAKPGGMKCCEGMEKTGEKKAGMPMKSEMKGDMKAKMEKIKEMKEKMAEKIGEKGTKMSTPEGKVEKNDSSKDAHQH